MKRPRAKEIASDYQLKGVTLGQVTNSPYLGVSISENLEWGDHISKIASKANSTLGFLKRNLKGCPSKLKEIAYFSMVRSLLEYSCPVWDPYRQGDIAKLNKIQRAAARFVTNNYQRKSSVTALIQDLGWTDLQTRRKNFRPTSLYKILNGLIAVPVSDLLTPADERTRGGHKKSFKHIRANTTLGQNHTRLESSSTSCYWIQINSSFQEPTERLVWSAAQHKPFAWYSVRRTAKFNL